MKSLKLFISLVAILSMAAFVGCENDPKDVNTNDKPIINLSTESMEVAAEGGEYSIEFSITNPHPSFTALVKCEAEWLTIIENTNEIIKFSVTANTSDQSRSANIVVKYIDTEEKSIVVTQSTASADILTVNIEGLTYNEFTVAITSANPDMYYVHYMSDADYFNRMHIDSEELVFEDDKNFFNSYASSFGQTIAEFMIQQGFALKGNQNIEWDNLVPAQKYVAYAYGISYNADQSDYTITTPLYYTIIDTPINEISQQEFTVDVTVDGADVEYNINPNGYNGQYTVLVYDASHTMYRAEGSVVDDAYTTEMAQAWMTAVNTLVNSYEMSTEEIYAAYCKSGQSSYGETLVANSDYMVAVFAVDTVDGLPMMTSKPIIKHFTTGEVAQSDMTFELQFNHAYTRVVDFVVTPSTDEDYTIFLVKSSYLEGLSTDEEILHWATTEYWLSVYNGEYHYNTSYLTPDCDYTILIFGYHGEVATTGLTRYDFRTESEAESLCEVSNISFNGPYDPVAIAELDPYYASFAQYAGYFVMWFTTETDKADECIAKYHYLYDTATVDSWGYDGIFGDLTAYTYNDVDMTAGVFNTEYIIASAVQDYKGNYSEMVYSEPFTYTEADMRDAQEFLDVINGETRSNIEVVLIGRDKIATLPLQK